MFNEKEVRACYKFLEHLKNEKVEIVHFYRMEEDLEEIFLRVLRL